MGRILTAMLGWLIAVLGGFFVVAGGVLAALGGSLYYLGTPNNPGVICPKMIHYV